MEDQIFEEYLSQLAQQPDNLLSPLDSLWQGVRCVLSGGLIPPHLPAASGVLVCRAGRAPAGDVLTCAMPSRTLDTRYSRKISFTC